MHWQIIELGLALAVVVILAVFAPVYAGERYAGMQDSPAALNHGR